MPSLITQCIVCALSFVLAVVKSVRFELSGVSEFELQRQAKQGYREAVEEQALRHERPLLVFVQRAVSLVLTIVTALVLHSGSDIWNTILFIIVWLIVAEFLSRQRFVRRFAERQVKRHHKELMDVVRKLSLLFRLIGIRPQMGGQRQGFYSKEELVHLLAHGHGALNPDEIKLVQRAISYSDTKLKDLMQARQAVVAIQTDEPVGPLLLDKLHKSGQTYFPVITKGFRQVLGIVNLTTLPPPRAELKLAGDVMEDRVYLNQNLPAEQVVRAFLLTKHHLFIVVNEYEEITGVVTIEQVLQWFFGRPPSSGFGQYEDLHAVARLTAIGEQRSASSRHRLTNLRNL